MATVLSVAVTGCSDSNLIPDAFGLVDAVVGGGNGRAFHAAQLDATTGDLFLAGGQRADGTALDVPFFAERQPTPDGGFFGDNRFDAVSTGRVNPLVVLDGGDLVAMGGQITGVTLAGAMPLVPPEFLPGGSLAVPDGDRISLVTGSVLPVAQAGGMSGAAMVRVDGSVYVLGGRDASGAISPDVRLLTGGTLTVVGQMTVPREGHTATALGNGDILVVGGFDGAATPSQSAELVDVSLPGAVATPLPSPLSTRALHTATADRDPGTVVVSRVLIYGGVSGVGRLVAGAFVAEVYDVGTAQFEPVLVADIDPLPRLYHTATRLENSDVLIAGGVENDLGSVTRRAQIFHFDVRQVRNTAGDLNRARFGHTATRLADGTVMVAGGIGGTLPNLGMVLEPERYRPAIR